MYQLEDYLNNRIEYRAYNIQMRFNQQWAQTDGLFWRLIIEGFEIHVSDFLIHSEVTTEVFKLNDEMKGNIITRGFPVFGGKNNRSVVIQKV